ncbi:NAD(P)-dependent oxidoreductase [soil metagenome]
MSTDDDRDEPPRSPGDPNGWPGLPIYDPSEDIDDFDDALDEEFEEDDFAEDFPRTILITGACGNIGRKLQDAWSNEYDLILLDLRADPEDPEVFAADLSELSEDWLTFFHGVDTVIHLAANPDPLAPWDELIGPNIDALANVLNASVLAGVERFVFASSNHAMGGYRDRGTEPITEDLPPLPDGPYGLTKLIGERLGQSASRAFDLTFLALRIGWVQLGENRPETLPDDWSRSMWLSNNDLEQLLRRAIEVDLEEVDFAVINGVSRNQGSRWDLQAANDLLGYSPEDDAYSDRSEES